MGKYKCAIFDLDGTIMDTSLGVLNSVNYTINKMGLKELTEDELRTFIGPPIQNSFKNKYSLDRDRTNEAATMFRNIYKQNFLYDANIFLGIEDLLSYLKNKNILTMVATYKREDYTFMLMEYFGLDKCFNYIKGSDMEGKLTKTDIVNLCIKESNCTKEEIVLIGDTMYDALGAKEAGVDFIAVTYGFGFKKNDKVEGSTHICDSVIELKEIF